MEHTIYMDPINKRVKIEENHNYRMNDEEIIMIVVFL